MNVRDYKIVLPCGKMILPPGNLILWDFLMVAQSAKSIEQGAEMDDSLPEL